MAPKKIKITCDIKSFAPIDDLVKFQGDLKTIEPEAIEKLKKSIVKYGFSFPIFMWQLKILDGHQRLEAVKGLIKDGYELENDVLPVVSIKAKNEKEAAEKLLLINSRYAKIDQHGFDFFVEEFKLDIIDMGGILDIPEIDFDLPDFEPATEEEQGRLDQLEPKMMTCPHCGEEFDARQQE